MRFSVQITHERSGCGGTRVIGMWWHLAHQTFLAGLALYKARPDKGYSLIDCISMETMRQEGTTEVLTHDSHFTQEGFTILL